MIVPEDKEQYSKEEIYEILRQVMFTGTPELYDNGGITGTINMPRNFTKVRAMEAFNKYYLKRNLNKHTNH
jgi:hypothetical protein